MTNTAAAMKHDDAQLEPAWQVMERIERELCDIARAIDRNQSLVAATAASLPEVGPAVLRAVQEADLLSQKVAGIAEYLAALSSSLPSDLEIDTGAALAGVKLAELGRRLSPIADQADGEGDAGFGDCDLF